MRPNRFAERADQHHACDAEDQADAGHVEREIMLGQILRQDERLHPGIDQGDEPPHDIDGDGHRPDHDEAGEEIAASRAPRCEEAGSVAAATICRSGSPRSGFPAGGVGFCSIGVVIAWFGQKEEGAGWRRGTQRLLTRLREWNALRPVRSQGLTRKQSTPLRFSAQSWAPPLSGKGPIWRR